MLLGEGDAEAISELINPHDVALKEGGIHRTGRDGMVVDYAGAKRNPNEAKEENAAASPRQ